MAAVLYERQGAVGCITLNRPERLNAINDELPRGIREAVQQCNEDDRVRVVLIQGAGKGCVCFAERSRKIPAESFFLRFCLFLDFAEGTI